MQNDAIRCRLIRHYARDTNDIDDANTRTTRIQYLHFPPPRGRVTPTVNAVADAAPIRGVYSMVLLFWPTTPTGRDVGQRRRTGGQPVVPRY